MDNVVKEDEWIPNNITVKKCIQFQPIELLSQTCFCGRERKRHLNQETEDVFQDWKNETHTTFLPTNVYGKATVMTTDNQKTIKFVRIADDTTGEMVEELLTRVWHLEHPKLAISLVRSSSCEEIDQSTADTIQSILEKIIKITDVWFMADATSKDVATTLFTDCFNDAIWKCKMKSNALIGFTSWSGLTKNRKKQLRASQGDRNQLFMKNHTEYSHVMFTDDGSKQKNGENRLKCTLEKHLLASSPSKVTVPVVKLLFGGNLDSIDDIYHGLHTVPRVPVIVFPYLGGLSEIIANAKERLECMRKMTKSKRRLSFSLYVKPMIHHISYDNVTPVHKARFISRLFYCLEECSEYIYINGEAEHLHEDLFHAFSGSCVQSSGNGETYLKIKDNIHYYRIKLSILFEEFEKINDKWFSCRHLGIGVQNKKKAIVKALLADRDTFVKKLINDNQCRVLTEFSDDVEVMELYYKKALNPDSLFYKFLSNNERQKIREDEYIDLTIAYEIIWKLVDQKYLYECTKLSMSQKLMFWAVLNNHQLTALYLWETSLDDALVNAIIVACAYKSMAKLKWFGTETRKELKRNRNEFIEMALRLLTCLYHQNENNAKRLVLMPNELWEGRSILQIARRFKFRDFIAHDCCQDIFNQFWKGKDIEKVLMKDGEESHRAWLELASKKLAKQGYEMFDRKDLSDGGSSDEFSQEFEDTYINKTMEDRKSHSVANSKSKLLHNGYRNDFSRINKDHGNSFISLKIEKLNNNMKSNRVSSAPVNRITNQSERKLNNGINNNHKKVNFDIAISPSHDNDNKMKNTDEDVVASMINEIENPDLVVENENFEENLEQELKSMSSSSHTDQSGSEMFHRQLKKSNSRKKNNDRKLSTGRKYGKSQKIWKNIKALFTVPKGKFILHVVLYLFFLGLFSHFLLTKHDHPEVEEWVIFTVVMASAIDEIYQIVTIDRSSRWKRLSYYLHSYWNILDLLAILLFIVGFILRRFESTKLGGLAVLAVDVALWYVKLFQFYRMSSVLGPYIVMMWRMVRHLLSFLVVLIVVVTAYGVFQRALLYMDVNSSPALIFQLFYKPFLLIFGEINVEDSLQSGKTVFSTSKHSQAIEITVAIGFCVYMFVTNVLLINLLIAIFNNIYEDVKNNSDIIWKFERTEMILEFLRKPALPIPFSTLSVIWSTVKTATGRYRSKLYSVQSMAGNGERMEFSKEMITKLKTKEVKMTKLFLIEKRRNCDDNKQLSSDEKISGALDDIKNIIGEYQRNQEDQSNRRIHMVNNNTRKQINDVLDILRNLQKHHK